MRIAIVLVALAGLFHALPAAAVPCAGFTDVDATDPFCANVQYLRNRSITLGCTSTTLYCPNAVVTRLSMAAFLNRLGAALTPDFRTQADTNIKPELVTGGAVCATPPYEVTGYPRVISAIGTVTHTAVSPTLVTAMVASSVDGVTWQPTSLGNGSAATNVSDGYVSQTVIGNPHSFAVGTSVRYAIVTNAAAVAGGWCNLSVRYDAYNDPM